MLDYLHIVYNYSYPQTIFSLRLSPLHYRSSFSSKSSRGSFWSLTHQEGNHICVKSGVFVRLLWFTQRPPLRARQFTFWAFFPLTEFHHHISDEKHSREFSVVGEVWLSNEYGMVIYINISTQGCTDFIWPNCMYLYFWYPSFSFKWQLYNKLFALFLNTCIMWKNTISQQNDDWEESKILPSVIFILAGELWWNKNIEYLKTNLKSFIVIITIDYRNPFV